jgi:hypothetical protein
MRSVRKAIASFSFASSLRQRVGHDDVAEQGGPASRSVSTRHEIQNTLNTGVVVPLNRSETAARSWSVVLELLRLRLVDGKHAPVFIRAATS